MGGRHGMGRDWTRDEEGELVEIVAGVEMRVNPVKCVAFCAELR